MTARLAGEWLPTPPPPEVLRRASRGCGWRRAGVIALWMGRAKGTWWTLHVRRIGPKRWEGQAFRFREAS